MLVFRSGALGVLQATTSVTPDTQQRLELHGTQGTIVVEGTEELWCPKWETERDGKRQDLEVPDEEDHAEVHPSTHGLPWLAKATRTALRDGW